MGQSAGAMSVQQLCVSPMTNGLFRGAVMMSGGGVSRLLGAAQKAEEAYPFWQAVRQKMCIRDRCTSMPFSASVTSTSNIISGP